MHACMDTCACVRACVRFSGMDGIGGREKLEMEEDLHIVESGGEKGGGITALPFVLRGGGERQKKRNPEDCPPIG